MSNESSTIIPEKLHAQKNYLGINFQKCIMTFRVIDYTEKCLENYPLIQNGYRQEKIIFELFSGDLQENPVRAPGAITGRALTGQGLIQENLFGESFSGALQENPVIAPGQLHEKTFTELFW